MAAATPVGRFRGGAIAGNLPSGDSVRGASDTERSENKQNQRSNYLKL
jgi:hypothetical protein